MQHLHSHLIYRALCGLLCLVVIGILTLGIIQISKGFRVETNLQSLFPQDEQDLVTQKLNNELNQAFGNHIILAIQADSDNAAQVATNQVEAAVVKTTFLKIRPQDDFSAQLSNQAQQLAPYQFQLLSTYQRELLLQQQRDPFIQHAQNVLLGFNVNPLSLPITQDPLDLFSSYLSSLQPPIEGEIQHNRLIIRHDGKSLVILPVVLTGDSFSLELQDQLNNWLSELKKQINTEATSTTLLTSGVIFHAARASQRAQTEINWLGAFDISGTLLVFILTFFSIRPLLLTLCSIGFGSLVAVIFNLAIFGKLHLIALVFGTSLIGVAIDYSVHYLCKHQAMFDERNPKKSSDAIIQKLMPALIMGLFASLIGYTCLFQAPLPGLKQIASFSVIGLSSAWLFVVVAFPMLMRKSLRMPHSFIDRLSFFAWQFWTQKTLAIRLTSFLLLLSTCIIGLLNVQQSNDIRLLYKPDTDLLESEKTLQELMRSVSPNQYYVLSDVSEETLLKKEEKFRTDFLDPMVRNGQLTGYFSTSQWVPSLSRQSENYLLIEQQLYQAPQGIKLFLQEAGFDETIKQDVINQFSVAKNRQLNPGLFMEYARPDQRILWLGKIQNKYVSVIALRGIKNAEALAAFPAQEGITWVNRIANMSLQLKSLSNTALQMLSLAYVAIGLLILFFYRTGKALLLLAVPLGASAIAISLLSIAGVSISLFHIFALYLIMGMGMDYAIFSYNEGLKDPISQRSIFLSALTSAMSFGVLSFSSTPMIQAFGSIMLIGSAMNLFLAPLVGYLSPTDKHNTYRAQHE